MDNDLDYIDYRTRHNVSSLLCSGLMMLSPYPWEAHFELSRQLTWGDRAAYDYAKRALDQLGWVTSARPTPFTKYMQGVNNGGISGRTVSFHLMDVDSCTFDMVGHSRHMPPMSTVERELLSCETIDSFVWLEGGLKYTTMELNRFADSVHLHAVQDWMRASEPLIRDVLDVHNLILRLMLQMTRDWYPVAKLLYPDFDMVFPQHVPGLRRLTREEFNQSRPIHPKHRRKLVHPDDDEVIAAVFDRAGAAQVADDPPAKFGSVSITV